MNDTEGRRWDGKLWTINSKRKGLRTKLNLDLAIRINKTTKRENESRNGIGIESRKRVIRWVRLEGIRVLKMNRRIVKRV